MACFVDYAQTSREWGCPEVFSGWPFCILLQRGACNRRAVGIDVKNDAGNMDELAITYDAVGAPQASNIDATEIADVVLTMRGRVKRNSQQAYNDYAVVSLLAQTFSSGKVIVVS